MGHAPWQASAGSAVVAQWGLLGADGHSELGSASHPHSERIFNTTLPQQGNLLQRILILQAWRAAQLLCAVLQASGCGARCSPSHCYAGPHLPSLLLSSPCKSSVRFMPSHLHGTHTRKHPIARTQFIFKSCFTFKSEWLASSASSDLTRDHEATLTVWYCLFLNLPFVLHFVVPRIPRILTVQHSWKVTADCLKKISSLSYSKCGKMAAISCRYQR